MTRPPTSLSVTPAKLADDVVDDIELIRLRNDGADAN